MLPRLGGGGRCRPGRPGRAGGQSAPGSEAAGRPGPLTDGGRDRQAGAAPQPRLLRRRVRAVAQLAARDRLCAVPGQPDHVSQLKQRCPSHSSRHETTTTSLQAHLPAFCGEIAAILGARTAHTNAVVPLQPRSVGPQVVSWPVTAGFSRGRRSAKGAAWQSMPQGQTVPANPGTNPASGMRRF